MNESKTFGAAYYDVYVYRDPETGVFTREEWSRDGKRDAPAGRPALIWRNAATGVILCEEWWKDGEKIEPPARPGRRSCFRQPQSKSPVA